MTGFAVSTEIKNVVVILSEAKNLHSGVRSDPEILRCAQDDGLCSYDEDEKRCGTPGEGRGEGSVDSQAHHRMNRTLTLTLSRRTGRGDKRGRFSCVVGVRGT